MNIQILVADVDYSNSVYTTLIATDDKNNKYEMMVKENLFKLLKISSSYPKNNTGRTFYAVKQETILELIDSGKLRKV